jgi:hypothetical protein
MYIVRYRVRGHKILCPYVCFRREKDKAVPCLYENIPDAI